MNTPTSYTDSEPGELESIHFFVKTIDDVDQELTTPENSEVDMVCDFCGEMYHLGTCCICEDMYCHDAYECPNVLPCDDDTDYDDNQNDC